MLGVNKPADPDPVEVSLDDGAGLPESTEAELDGVPVLGSSRNGMFAEGGGEGDEVGGLGKGADDCGAVVMEHASLGRVSWERRSF
jgi:hypothetical protein